MQKQKKEMVSLELKDEIKEMVKSTNETDSSYFKKVIGYDFIRSVLIKMIETDRSFFPENYLIKKVDYRNENIIDFDFDADKALKLLSIFKDKNLREKIDALPASKHFLYNIIINNRDSYFQKIDSVEELDEITDYIFNTIDSMESRSLKLVNLRFISSIFGVYPKNISINNNIIENKLDVDEVLAHISNNFNHYLPVIKGIYPINKYIFDDISEYKGPNTSDFIGVVLGELIQCKKNDNLKRQKLWLLTDLQFEYLNNLEPKDSILIAGDNDGSLVAFNNQIRYEANVFDIIERFETDYMYVKEIINFIERNEKSVVASSRSFENLFKSFLYMIYSSYHTPRQLIYSHLSNINDIKYDINDTIPQLLDKASKKLGINGTFDHPYETIRKLIDINYESIMKVLLNIKEPTKFTSIKSTMILIQVFNDIVKLFMKSEFVNKFIIEYEEDVRLIEKLSKTYNANEITFSKYNSINQSRIYISLDEFNFMKHTRNPKLVGMICGENDMSLYKNSDLFVEDSDYIFELISAFNIISDASTVGGLFYNDFSVDYDNFDESVFTLKLINAIIYATSFKYNDKKSLFSIIKSLEIIDVINELDENDLFKDYYC